jgi:hypothetical protein
MTLITIGNSEGSRRCDARCYDAKGSNCDCMCGGKNHGKGLQVASENTALIGKKLMEELGGEHVAIAAIQRDLFTGGAA